MADVDLAGFGYDALKAGLCDSVLDCRACPRLQAHQARAQEARAPLPQPLTGRGSANARIVFLVDEPTSDELLTGIADHVRWLYLARLIAYAWVEVSGVPAPAELVSARKLYLMERAGDARNAVDTVGVRSMAEALRAHVFYTAAIGCPPTDSRGGTKQAELRDARACRTARLNRTIYALDPYLIVAVGLRALNRIRVVEATPPEALADGILETMVQSPCSKDGIPYALQCIPDVTEVMLAGERDMKQVKHKKGLHYEITQGIAAAIRLVDRLSIAAYGTHYATRPNA